MIRHGTTPERRMMHRAQLSPLLLWIAVAVAFAGGCSVINTVLDTVQGTGLTGLSNDQMNLVKSGVQVGEKLVDAVDTITPEQEYIIGRAAAAKIIERYGVYENDEANHYLNLLGNAVANYSDLPEVYSGYHFLILDSDEINAFAVPGAFVFVTRGLLKCCATEDQLVAVVAHEIAHVQNRHAIKSIKSSRWSQVLTTAGSEAMKRAGGRNLAALTDQFEGVLEDVTDALIVNGYSRSMEAAADRDGVAIVARCGYDPTAMIQMLETMKQRLGSESKGFGSTHPSPDDRLAKIRPLIASTSAGGHVPARQARFDTLLAEARGGR